MAINYIEKGIGLHNAITESGNWLVQVDGVWVSSDDTAVQAIIDGYTLDQAKSAKCAEVVSKATDIFNRAIAGYSPGELAGWPILRAEAVAYNADSTAAVPAITCEAGIRGMSVADLVSKVTTNATRYDQLRAQIAGNSGKHRDAITSLSDFAAVVAYDYSTGWPGE